MDINYDQFNGNTLIFKYNIDEYGNPISIRVDKEEKQVSIHGTIQLEFIPDELNRVVILNEDNSQMTEVFNRDEIKPNTYYIDYNNGVAYLDKSQFGKTKIYNYYNKGLQLIGCSRIYDEHDVSGKDVVVTLQEIIDAVKEYISILGTFEQATIIIKKLEQNIKTGDALHKNLTNDIEIGTPLQEKLHNDIVDAKGWKDQLHNDVQEGKTLQPLLEQTVNDGNATKQQLDQSITNAQDDIAKIEATGNEIVNIISSEWRYNDTSKMYEKQITHTCNSENVHVTCKTSDTKEALFLPWKIVDKSNILLKSDEAINVSIILSASFYKATQTISDNIAEEVVNARKGKTSLLEKVDSIDEHLDTKVHKVDSVASLKKIGTFKKDDVVEVISHLINVNGGYSKYNIRLKKDDDVIDDVTKIQLNNSFIAEMIFVNERIDVMQCGAVGDGLTDDSNAFQKAINIAYSLKIPVYVPSRFKFHIAKPLEVEYWRPLTIMGDGYGVNNANESQYCNIYCTCDFLKRKNDGNIDKRARINLKYLNICFYDNLEDKNTVTSHSVFNGVSLQNAHIDNCYFYGLGYFIYNGNLNFVCKIENNQFIKINKAFICTYDRVDKPTLSSIHYLSDSYITTNYINGNPETNPTFILGLSDVECDNLIENNYIDYFAYLFQCELNITSGYYAIGKIVNNTLSSCFRITDNKIKGIFIDNHFENWNRTMLDEKFTNQTEFMKKGKVGAFIIDPLDNGIVDFRWTTLIDNYLNKMDYFIFIVNAPSTSTSFMREFCEVGTRIMDPTSPTNDMFYYRPYNAGSRAIIFNTKIESLNYSTSSENAPTNLIQTYEYNGQTYSYFTGYKGQIKYYADGVFLATQLNSSWKWVKIGDVT